MGFFCRRWQTVQWQLRVKMFTQRSGFSIRHEVGNPNLNTVTIKSVRKYIVIMIEADNTITVIFLLKLAQSIAKYQACFASCINANTMQLALLISPNYL